MKSFIFYGSPVKHTHAHRLVTQPPQPEYFVRAETVDGDEAQALDRAKPMMGETVLNSVLCFQPHDHQK